MIGKRIVLLRLISFVLWHEIVGRQHENDTMPQADNPNSFSESTNEYRKLDDSVNLGKNAGGESKVDAAGEGGKSEPRLSAATPEQQESSESKAFVFDIGNPNGVESLAAYYKLPEQKWEERLAKLSWTDD
jgi:hypothetical protein